MGIQLYGNAYLYLCWCRSPLKVLKAPQVYYLLREKTWDDFLLNNTYIAGYISRCKYFSFIVLLESFIYWKWCRAVLYEMRCGLIGTNFFFLWFQNPAGILLIIPLYYECESGLLLLFLEKKRKENVHNDRSRRSLCITAVTNQASCHDSLKERKLDSMLRHLHPAAAAAGKKKKRKRSLDKIDRFSRCYDFVMTLCMQQLDAPRLLIHDGYISYHFHFITKALFHKYIQNSISLIFSDIDDAREGKIFILEGLSSNRRLI